jgi:hypothetical protein
MSGQTVSKSFFDIRKRLFNDDDIYEPSYYVPNEKELVENIIKPIQKHILDLLQCSESGKLINFCQIIIYVCASETVISKVFDTDTFKKDYYNYYKRHVNFTKYIVEYKILKSIILSQLDGNNQCKIDIIQTINLYIDDYINTFRNRLISDLPFYMIKKLLQNNFIHYDNDYDVSQDINSLQFNVTHTKHMLDIIHGSFDPQKLIKELVSKHIITHTCFITRLQINIIYLDTQFTLSQTTIQKIIENWKRAQEIMNILNIISYLCYTYKLSFMNHSELVSLFSPSWISFYNKNCIYYKQIIDDSVEAIYNFMNSYIKDKIAIHIISNQWCDTMHNPKYVYCKMKVIKTMINNGIENINPTMVELIKKRELLQSGRERHDLWLQIVPLIKKEFK